jgi:hypothetical protein
MKLWTSTVRHCFGWQWRHKETGCLHSQHLVLPATRDATQHQQSNSLATNALAGVQGTLHGTAMQLDVPQRARTVQSGMWIAVR